MSIGEEKSQHCCQRQTDWSLGLSGWAYLQPESGCGMLELYHILHQADFVVWLGLTSPPKHGTILFESQY